MEKNMKKVWIVIACVIGFGGGAALGGVALYNAGNNAANEKVQKAESEKVASEKDKKESKKAASEKAKKESKKAASEKAKKELEEAAVSEKKAAEAVKSVSAEQAMSILQNSAIPASEKRDAQVRSTNTDGSVMLASYAGAKGENRFVVRAADDGSYTVDAVYGTLAGGAFAPFPNQSMYGPSQVVVSN